MNLHETKRSLPVFPLAKFRAVLHEAIQNGLREDLDEVQRNGAIQQHSGWMHIHDDRNVPALGRIGDVDDIIASVLVEEGKVRVSFLFGASSDIFPLIRLLFETDRYLRRRTKLCPHIDLLQLTALHN